MNDLNSVHLVIIQSSTSKQKSEDSGTWKITRSPKSRKDLQIGIRRESDSDSAGRR